MINNPPQKIYLQWDGDAEPPEVYTSDPDDRDVTWCRERVFERDIEYVRVINRPQDGRVCNCEDAPCCGHYEL
jgi:hypothetical protein